MELESVHDAYKKQLEQLYEKHQVELNETEQRHRDQIKHMCAEHSLEISNVKQTLKSLYETEIGEVKDHYMKCFNDLNDCELDKFSLTKRIEDGLTKIQAQHKKIVSNLLNGRSKSQKVYLL